MSSASEQIAILVDGLAAGGLTVINEFNPSDRPITLVVVDETKEREFRVFCWNVTHGGHGRSADEYRVQATRTGDIPLHVPGVETLVLGLYDDLEVFAAWDARKHQTPSPSPSLQVRLETLQRAAESGFAARERPLAAGEVEVVVAFRPELVRDYIDVLPGLDVDEETEATYTAAAASGDELTVEELPGDVERRRKIVSVSRAIRNAQFRLRVLHAYGHRCAFCGLAAGLSHAAHIRPIHLGGADQVKNGLAACPTHHAAFDHGLILIADDFTVALNDDRLDEIDATDEDREALSAGLYEMLQVPSGQDLQPASENLAAHRGIWG